MTNTQERSADRSPRMYAPRFDCPRCGAFADQDWFDLVRDGTFESQFVDTLTVTSIAPGISTAGGIGGWRVSICASCEDRTVWRDDDIVYPRTSTIPPASKDMPELVRELYDEGRDVWPISRRAGAALARAALEAMLRSEESASKKDNLDTLIGKAVPSLPTYLGRLLDVVRHAGNKSLHVEEEPDEVMLLVLDEKNTEIGPVIFEAVNQLVDERITKPAAVGALFDNLPEGVKETIKRREKKESIAASP